LGQANLTQNDVLQFHPFTSEWYFPLPLAQRLVSQ
jgi:hypothetical protein